jgi:hypothetical protein
MYYILKEPLISLRLSIVFLRGPSKPYRLGVRVHISSILPKVSLQSMFFFGKFWQQIAKLAKFTLGKQTFPIFLSKFFAGKKNCLQCSEHVLANM